MECVMLVVGPEGELVEVPVFQASVIDFFSRIGAGSFSTRPVDGISPGVAAFTAMVMLPGTWEIAAGRSVDEACVRLVSRVAQRLTCPQCNRAVLLDEQVIAPMTVEDRDYLGPSQIGFSICTLYFDHRDAAFKRACDGFDPDIDPRSDFVGEII